MAADITLYTDGACSGNPGPGGYAAILVARDDKGRIIKTLEITGGEPETTNNRMEIRAVIEGLRALTAPAALTIVSDSQYVIKTMTQGWKRKKNEDLWAELDAQLARHHVTWQYVRGHDGHEYNERCDRLAVAAIDAFRR
ncbi:ribonuclease H [Kamptonema cortianum]|jgi:ribonuclease HI|nr:ribonuclease H [Kamptonema cortianum]